MASIEENIGTAVRNAIWGPIDSVIAFFTDPFWAVLGIALLIVAIAIVLMKFFPEGRSIWGASAIGAVLYAIGFRKGEKAEKDRRKR